MADQQNVVNAIPMMLTGTGSSVIGDQVGNPLADIAVWLTSKACGCVLPDSIEKAYHTLFVFLIVGSALFIHGKFAKQQGS